MIRVIRAHLEKRMGTRLGSPKVHISHIQRFAKLAFTFYSNSLPFITKDSFEPFWLWFIDIEDLIERVKLLPNLMVLIF